MTEKSTNFSGNLRRINFASLSKLRKRSEILLRRRSLSAWAEAVADLSPARHHLEWITALENRSIRRLLIIAPPGHAKTSWVSIYYPVWRIGSDPNLHFCLLSNTAGQAYRPSVAARELIKNSDAYHKIFPQIKPDYIKGWAEKEWFVQRANVADKDATMIAAGVFGPILGARFDELILDDVVDQENSATARQREKMWEWVKATAISRLTPNGRIVCICTRWHERDLAAELIAMGGFKVIHMPAIGYYGEGQALWPEVWPVEKLEEKRRDQGSLRFEGMYQGNPTIPEGSILKRAWWKFEHELPDAYEGTLQVWDTAFRESEEADYSVCVTMSVLAGHVYVRGVFRERLAWPDLVRALHSQYEHFLPQRVLIEDRASGQSLLQALRTENLPVIPIKADKSKLARTTAISGFVEAGRVHLPRNTTWAEDLVEECAAFPRGAHDDQVDALVHGLTYLFLQQKQEVVVELDPYGLENQISPELDEVDGYF